MKNVIYEVEIAGCKIQIIENGHNHFDVVYGQQVKRRLTYMSAAHEFGECLMHALCCAGKLDKPF